MRFNYWQTFYEDSYYHVYNRAIGKERLFTTDNNYNHFLKKWRQYIHPYVDTYAYCLMSNHFHFLVKIKPVTSIIKQSIEAENTVASKNFLADKISLDVFLEDQFKRFFSSYALGFNKRNERHGSLFQTRFKRVKLRSEKRILDTVCYVHHNPIHHNLSPFYDAWRYSSYSSFLSNQPTLLSRKEGLALFDGLGLTAKAFLYYHDEYRKEWNSWKRPLDWEDELLLDDEDDDNNNDDKP